MFRSPMFDTTRIGKPDLKVASHDEIGVMTGAFTGIMGSIRQLISLVNDACHSVATCLTI